MSNLKEQYFTGSQNSIRSYASRTAKLKKSHLKLWENQWDKFALSLNSSKNIPDLLDLDSIFKRTAPKVLEIGFGDGRAFLEMAASHPDWDFIGVEVYLKGLVDVLKKCAEHNCGNVRLFWGDAFQVLQQKIPMTSLDRIQIFFPDPWPKTRHHKRRLINSEFIEELGSKLKPSGILHLATDWEDYAKQMIKVIEKNPVFERKSCEDHVAIEAKSIRPLTKYELRGAGLGHKIFDLIYARI